MAKSVQLLLLESVENLGLVGDVVKVKSGYARNYLLPHGRAEPPTPTKIDALKEARAHAQAELAALRAEREKIVEQIAEASIEIERSCNDQGALYGSVTHRDISDALLEAGYGVDVRSVRLTHSIRRIGSFPVPIQFDKDLRAEITLVVKADRPLEGFTETGEPIEPQEPETADKAGDAGEAADVKRQRRGEKKHDDQGDEASR